VFVYFGATGLLRARMEWLVGNPMKVGFRRQDVLDNLDSASLSDIAAILKKDVRDVSSTLTVLSVRNAILLSPYILRILKAISSSR
jgi:hypothetical protein